MNNRKNREIYTALFLYHVINKISFISITNKPPLYYEGYYTIFTIIHSLFWQHQESVKVFFHPQNFSNLCGQGQLWAILKILLMLVNLIHTNRVPLKSVLNKDSAILCPPFKYNQL